MSLTFMCKVAVFMLALVARAAAHGYITEPVSRQALVKSISAYYNGLNCGGFAVQWEQNHGKCGICGDAFNKPYPRENEAGGKNAPFDRPITKHYQEGQNITVEIMITSPHQGGYSEFKICPNNDLRSPANQSCLDKHMLSTPSGETRMVHTPYPGPLRTTLVLPRGLTCTQCVLQWKWVTNTNNHCNSITKEYCNCLACGPQETFAGCADVAINPAVGGHETVSQTLTTSRPIVTQQQHSGFLPIDTGNKGECTLTALSRKLYGAEMGLKICKTQCSQDSCPMQLCTKGCRV